MSPLPLPVAPWHMAQSYPYIFLTRAWDSGVGLTGLTICAASAGIADWAGGAAGCCGAPAKSNSAGRMNKGFSIRASCSCIAERMLCLRRADGKLYLHVAGPSTDNPRQDRSCSSGSLPADLSGLRQSKVLRDHADLGANGLLILSEALEHEDAAVDVDGDMVALAVFCVDLCARQTEMTALIDVPEHAVAELDWMDDCRVQGAESVFGPLQGDGACHLVSYALLVGGRPKVGLRLEGEAEATVGFAIGRQDEIAGKHLQKLRRAVLVVLMSLVLSAEVVGVGHEVVDATLFGCSF